MSAEFILGCRAEIAGPIEDIITTRSAAGWPPGDIAEHLHNRGMPVTTEQVRHILDLD